MTTRKPARMKPVLAYACVDVWSGEMWLWGDPLRPEVYTKRVDAKNQAPNPSERIARVEIRELPRKRTR